MLPISDDLCSSFDVQLSVEDCCSTGLDSTLSLPALPPSISLPQSLCNLYKLLIAVSTTQG